ncbi:MAG: hypothetical protein GY853_16220 [PVC group bacterium]|nr:hypothetical protein [PVC group bacterium]
MSITRLSTHELTGFNPIISEPTRQQLIKLDRKMREARKAKRDTKTYNTTVECFRCGNELIYGEDQIIHKNTTKDKKVIRRAYCESCVGYR